MKTKRTKKSPQKPIRMGDALAGLGRKIALPDDTFAKTDKAKCESFYNVWDALCDTGGDATKMKLRSWLMMELQQHIKAQGWSKTAAKKRCGARVADLRGKFTTFTADELAELLGGRA